ncbi:MAG: sensor histidine kinase [Ignavibacteria bacterium]|nr:sensor histidine kinase [Ignavibacteria bacterium]
MLIQIALIISTVLQLVAVVLVITMIKGSKYKSSYILLASGLAIMAARRIIEYLFHINWGLPESTKIFSNWLGVLISVLLVIGVFYLKKIFGYIAYVQKVRQENEKRVLAAIITTEEKERMRIAKDLHDGLGPLLASLKMSLSALRPVQENGNMKEIYKNTIRLSEEAVKSLKEISNNLSPHILENFGLVSAIQSFINTFDLAGKIKIEFRHNIENKRFESNVETIIYRAVCELIHNTFKHACANKVLLSLDKESGMLKLLFQDDGCGFDVENSMNQETKGIGLHNIQSRVSSINGKFSIQSQQGEGVIVNIEVKI